MTIHLTKQSKNKTSAKNRTKATVEIEAIFRGSGEGVGREWGGSGEGVWGGCGEGVGRNLFSSHHFSKKKSLKLADFYSIH